MQTYARTRKHGTRDTMAGNGIDRMASIRAIVDNKQYAKVDGFMIDLFTASAICNVYDALSEDNREKYSKFPAAKMGIVAHQLIK